MDSAVTVSHQSYGSRVKNSFAGMCMAPIFLILGIWLLVWNEGNSIFQHKALDEGLKAVSNIGAASVDSANEGKLVHIVGEAIATSEPTDPIFGVTAPDALVLRRTVEMYQWVQSKNSDSKKNTGGSTTTTTTYSYSKQWRGKIVNSDKFQEPTGHQNPGTLRYPSNTILAKPVFIEAFELPDSVMQQMMKWFQPLSDGSIAAIPDTSSASDAVPYGDGFYFGAEPSAPEVGDTRVIFAEVSQQTVSVIAMQTKSTLAAYTTSFGTSVLMVERGVHDAAEMFLHANNVVSSKTWLIRIGGFFIIWVAFNSLVAPLSTMADAIPAIGNLIQMAQGCLAFFLSAALSIIVIGLAWFAYRPVFSIVLFLMVGGGSYALRKHTEKDKGVNVQDYEIPTMQFKDETMIFTS